MPRFSVGSSFERGRVLQELVSRRDASPETCSRQCGRPAAWTGGFERANVLLATAKSHRLEEPARDAYIAVADKLGSHEQGQVFAALVKSESRK